MSYFEFFDNFLLINLLLLLIVLVNSRLDFLSILCDFVRVQAIVQNELVTNADLICKRVLFKEVCLSNTSLFFKAIIPVDRLLMITSLYHILPMLVNVVTPDKLADNVATARREEIVYDFASHKLNARCSLITCLANASFSYRKTHHHEKNRATGTIGTIGVTSALNVHMFELGDWLVRVEVEAAKLF